MKSFWKLYTDTKKLKSTDRILDRLKVSIEPFQIINLRIDNHFKDNTIEIYFDIDHGNQSKEMIFFEANIIAHKLGSKWEMSGNVIDFIEGYAYDSPIVGIKNVILSLTFVNQDDE